ncbi:hypothetical protein D3C78_1246030 [compost metagenome]
MAPPLTFNLLCGTPVSCIQANGTEAKASLTSNRSMSLILSPALPSTFWVAAIGPVSINVGSEPTVVKATTRARALRPSFFAVSALINSNAAAPSEICDELPAVMRPVSGRKLVLSVDSFSRDVSRRMVSS